MAKITYFVINHGQTPHEVSDLSVTEWGVKPADRQVTTHIEDHYTPASALHCISQGRADRMRKCLIFSCPLLRMCQAPILSPAPSYIKQVLSWPVMSLRSGIRTRPTHSAVTRSRQAIGGDRGRGSTRGNGEKGGDCAPLLRADARRSAKQKCRALRGPSKCKALCEAEVPSTARNKKKTLYIL